MYHMIFWVVALTTCELPEPLSLSNQMNLEGESSHLTSFQQLETVPNRSTLQFWRDSKNEF